MNIKTDNSETECSFEDTGTDPDNNAYIESVLDNAKENIENAKANIDDKKPNIETADVKPESVKYNRFLPLQLFLLVVSIICGIIQTVLMTAVPASVYFIASVWIFVLIFAAGTFLRDQAMSIISGVLILFALFIVICGYPHGIRREDLTRWSILNIQENNMRSPNTYNYDVDEDAIAEDFAGKFVYYYKYGCHDCKDIKNETETILKENGCDVVYIETRSDAGQKFLSQYPVTEVPAGLVIKDENEYEIRILYKQVTVDGKKKSIIDTDAMDILLSELSK